MIFGRVICIFNDHELLNNQDEQNNITTRDTELNVTGGGSGKFDELDRPLEKEEVEKKLNLLETCI